MVPVGISVEFILPRSVKFFQKLHKRTLDKIFTEQSAVFSGISASFAEIQLETADVLVNYFTES